MKKYGKVCLGGTFDNFHSGHKSLFSTAFSLTDEIIIGLTSDVMAKRNRNGEHIASYSNRLKFLEKFLSDNFRGSYSIVKLNDDWGPGVFDQNLDAIIVSEETEKVAIELNVNRKLRNLNELEIDFLTLSGHKIGAPSGIGALINNNQFNLAPQILGGGQEKGIRAGTENILGILGFGEAALIMSEMPKKNDNQVKYLRDYLSNKIKKIRPETLFFGQNSNRVSNTLLMALPNIPGDLALMKLDLASFSVSSGSACSSGKISKSHVVSAMGYEDLASNSIRLSFPPNDTILEAEGLITTEELDNLAECWLDLK